MRHPTWRHLVLAAFGALITFGCILRFWKLTGVGLWYDELWTVVGASNRPFMEMYREWILGDSHPPGFFLFYFIWFKIVPNTELWARLPSAVAGVMMVLYLLFRTDKVLTRDERILTASFASLSSACIFYALTVKQYSAMMLVSAIATMSYLEIIRANRVDRRTGITLGTACVALAYLNHFGLVYAWMLLAFLAFTFRRDREQLRRVARIAVVFAVAYVPCAPFLYIQLAYSTGDWQPYDVGAFLSALLPSIFFDDRRAVSLVLGLLVGGLCLVRITRQQTRDALRSRRNGHVAAIIATFAGFMVVLGLVKPIFFVRYFLVGFPVLFVGLGILTAAACSITSDWVAVVPLAFFLRAAVIQFHAIDGLHRQQWDKSVDLVLEWKKPDEPVYVLGAKTDETEFEYLREGNVDGVYYVRNVKFYEYYFKRRGADAIAAHLEVVEPTVDAVEELAAKYRGTGTTVYVLAGHHIRFRDEALTALEQIARVDVTTLYSTLVYKLTF